MYIYIYIRTLVNIQTQVYFEDGYIIHLQNPSKPIPSIPRQLPTYVDRLLVLAKNADGLSNATRDEGIFTDRIGQTGPFQKFLGSDLVRWMEMGWCDCEIGFLFHPAGVGFLVIWVKKIKYPEVISSCDEFQDLASHELLIMIHKLWISSLFHPIALHMI